MIPSFPELWTVAPNHCFDLSSIMVPEALLFPAKIELKVHIFSQVKKQNLSIKKRDRSCTVNTFSIIPVYTVRGLETRKAIKPNLQCSIESFIILHQNTCPTVHTP